MTQVEKPGRALTVREVLKNRDFRLLWAAQGISDLGDSLTNLSLFILINRLTGSSAALALMSIVLLVPQVVFGLLAGVYVDRLDRKRIMISSDLIRAGLVLGFGLVGTPDMVWLLYLLGFLQAGVGTLFTPAQSAMLPLVVPVESLVAANSLTQTTRMISLTLGGALAGLMAGLFKVFWPVFGLDALTFLVSVLLVSRLKTPRHLPATASDKSFGATMRQLREGLYITTHNRALLGTLTAAGVALLGLGATNVLFVPLLVNELKAPETWLGAVQFAATLAMLLSGSIVALLAARVRPTRLVSLGLLVFGVVIGGVGLVQSPWQLLITHFMIGLCVTPINISIVTINQAAVADNIRGRVSSARATLASCMNLLSLGLAGAFGDFIGVRNVFFLAGVCVVGAGLASGRIFKGISKP